LIIIHSIYVKPHDLSDKNLFVPGLVCDCIYDKDGTYHPCEIEKITEEGYHIKFQKYHTQEIVPFCFLKIRKSNYLGKRDVMSGDQTEFILPDNLRVKPNDSEAQRLQKRKKVKNLKRRFKMNLIEKDNKLKKQSWCNFNKKAKRKRRGYFAINKQK